MESSVDEIIIELVRENKCLYDKSDPNFKNISKKKGYMVQNKRKFGKFI